MFDYYRIGRLQVVMLLTLNFDNPLLQVHYYRGIWPCKWPWNDLVTEETHEGRNEAVNDTVNYQRVSLSALFHHFTASWRNNCRIKCRYKCRSKDIVSIWSLMIVFLLSGENENDNRNEYTNLHRRKIPNCGEAVGDSMLGQIYRFTLTSSNLYTLRRVEKE